MLDGQFIQRGYFDQIMPSRGSSAENTRGGDSSNDAVKQRDVVTCDLEPMGGQDSQKAAGAAGRF